MDRGSFEDEFEALYVVAYRVAYRVVGSRPEAEEVAQEALVRAFVAWNRIVGDGRAWVATVSAGVAIDTWRRKRRGADPSRGDAQLAWEVAVTERIVLRDAPRSLPRRQRAVVVMRYLADLSEVDVAEALGCSTGTVKTHASRGLAALRLQLNAVETSEV